MRSLVARHRTVLAWIKAQNGTRIDARLHRQHSCDPGEEMTRGLYVPVEG